ncbi:MAG TPA: hypothetical protein VHG10_02480 [Glycomyces sp.]|nr:hypothetical protein [Glycomyces sp.]
MYDAALSRHFGEHPSSEQVFDLIERVADRHPQYAGGVRRVLRSTEKGQNSGLDPRQVLTAQHLVIREIAKLHPDFRERADRLVEAASRTLVPVGVRSVESGQDHARSDTAGTEFTGTDAKSVVSVTLGLDGAMRALELLRGVERMGGRSIGAAIVRAWVAAEKQRWSCAKELGLHDSFPEIGSGKGGGDSFRCEAYSASRLCRATVDRYGRLRAVTFMRTGLFDDDGRLGLAAEIREAITEAQNSLTASW